MLLEFADRMDESDTFDLELTGAGHLDLNVVTSEGYAEVVSFRDEDLVRFATALLTVPRHHELRIESFPLGEQVRFGNMKVDVPDNEASANAVLERASALLASVGLYQENAKRKAEEAARKKVDAERFEQAAGIKAAVKKINPFLMLSDSDVEILRDAGIRFETNV